MTEIDSDVNEDLQAFEIEISHSSEDVGSSESARQLAAATSYTPDYVRPPARRPANEREGSFSAFGWLLDGATGLIGEIRHNDLGLSEEFWVHAYAARREGALAVQALLSDILSRAASRNGRELDNQTRRERRGNIEIDF